MTAPRRIRWGWLAVALVAAAVTLFLLLGVRVGTCVDSVAGYSECTSGPVGGMPGAVGTAGIGLGVVGLSARRAFRR
ncbi:hypothetical protein [Sanguibacter sp. 25GB23B1]|uniref:hypothetical protein n=1 Tax=unclassified Sanguibacter TaxID=2645534 RepID=UPI0032AF4DA2